MVWDFLGYQLSQQSVRALYAAGGTVAAKTQPPVIISPPKPPKEGIPEWVWIAGIGLVGAYFILRK